MAVNVFSLKVNHTAPAVDIILFVAKVIFEPGRKRKEVDEN